MEKKKMTLRPFNPNDAETILSWCKDKHAFQLWSADRYKDFPAQPEEMMEQYEGGNMYPLTAVIDDIIVGPFNDYSIAVNYYLSQQFLQTLGLNLIKIPAFGPKVCIF